MQNLEELVVPRERVAGPLALDAGGGGVLALAGAALARPRVERLLVGSWAGTFGTRAVGPIIVKKK